MCRRWRWVLVLLALVGLLSACADSDPTGPSTHVFSPGPQYKTTPVWVDPGVARFGDALP